MAGAVQRIGTEVHRATCVGAYGTERLPAAVVIDQDRASELRVIKVCITLSGDGRKRCEKDVSAGYALG